MVTVEQDEGKKKPHTALDGIRLFYALFQMVALNAEDAHSATI
jgi:hypothetical protein